MIMVATPAANSANSIVFMVFIFYGFYPQIPAPVTERGVVDSSELIT